MFRLVGALCIFISCSAGGFAASAKLNADSKQIHAFSEALALIRAEIAFGAHSLPEIFYEAAMSAPAPLCALFRQISDAIMSDPGTCLSTHVNAAIHALPVPLPCVIGDAIRYLGSTLGGADAEGQIHAVALCEERLRAAERSDEARLPALCRAYRSAGVCVGAVLAILVL